jgi:hypothetical protein
VISISGASGEADALTSCLTLLGSTAMAWSVSAFWSTAWLVAILAYAWA